VMMAAIMMLPIAAFASSVYSDEGPEYEVEEFDHWGWMHDNVTAVTLEIFTGVVTSVELIEPVVFTHSRPATYYLRQLGSMREFTHEYTIIYVEGEDDTLAFRVHFLLSIFIGDEVAVGDTVTVYFETYQPPTQAVTLPARAWVIVNGDFDNLIISRFDRNGLNYDGSLKLDVSGEFEFAHMSGMAFVPVYPINTLGFMLMVVYEDISDGTPAVITPSLIVELFEIYRHDSTAFVRGVLDFSAYDVFVGSEGLPGATVAWIDDDAFPTHAQLRPVLEAFGIEPGWDAATREVTFTNLNDEEVSFRVGSNVVTVGGQVIPIFRRYVEVPLLQRSVIINNSTYVPFDFFIDAVGICHSGSGIAREGFGLAGFSCQCL